MEGSSVELPAAAVTAATVAFALASSGAVGSAPAVTGSGTFRKRA